MSKKKNTDSVFDISHIKYRYISELSFTYHRPETSTQDNDGVSYAVDFSKMINFKENAIRIICTIAISEGEVNEEHKPEFEYRTDHVFDIANIKNYVKLVHASDGSESYKVTNDLDSTLSTISYSTTRGMLHSKLHGTHLSRFILPITRPSDLK